MVKMLAELTRKACCRVLTGRTGVLLEGKAPPREEIARKFEGIEELGVYVHIPFCRQICPYCPYNKEIHSPDLAGQYTRALAKEIDLYSEIVGNRPITTLYIGGGTPTTMLSQGLPDLVKRIQGAFNLRCGIHMESHPSDLTAENLKAIRSLGVEHLSTGVEALQDKHLRFLKRPYTVAGVRAAVQRAVAAGFECVNVDVIFALPGQSYREIEETGHALVELGVDQVATYPLFRFPYTLMGSDGRGGNYGISSVFRRRRMLQILEQIFYKAGYERTSAWAFTRAGVPRYCSVTVPLYIGLGASAGSYLKDVFYLNTFNVAEYVKAIEDRGTATALTLDLPERMQMAGWLYWRVYETRFRKQDFQKRFGRDFDSVFGTWFKLMGFMGFLNDDGERIVLTDRGNYWLHAVEDLFSLDYISKLWGTSKQEPWPETVHL
jgi:oxygen-independent coproporphyrinogen-3 oxidase